MAFHRLPWADFDAIAQMKGGKPIVRRLRSAERSRRKLLLSALLEAVAKAPEQFGPLPSAETLWELLARVEAASPAAFDRLLDHPYTGSWAGYTTRLLRNDLNGVGPLWIHLGHAYTIAAAAAIRAGLRFDIAVPLWKGNVALPTLGMARLRASSPFSVAEVGGGPGNYVIRHGARSVRVPDRAGTDGPGWWGLRRLRTAAGDRRFSVALDDLDPYRGLYEPVPPQRLSSTEFSEWSGMLVEAWRLLVKALPDYSSLLSAGLNSLVPRPPVLFRNPSASTGEAFGSAVLGRPTDTASLAATLVHEFQHVVLGGVLHLTRLCDEDPRERFYVPWRDDPRPLAGAIQGTYAFLGVTAFWRRLASVGPGPAIRRAWFEFAYWRAQTWRTLEALRGDASLTAAGRRFLDGVAGTLGPWRHERIEEDIAVLAGAAMADHRAGWRSRHLRPSPGVVGQLVDCWLAGESRPPVSLIGDELSPTPVPDGAWSHARADLVRLALTGAGDAELEDVWPTVPGATAADFAYATGRYDDATRRYRAELAETPDRPASLVGLGLALAETGPNSASRALLYCPELVRAVHRELRGSRGAATTTEGVASWLGQLVTE
ncbi:HEXXH motif domain-containing protein [Amycolatopsis pigmentata]|uniref:HEXXH motif domain-containing protein n=1 Tax=Amycolatopsis pigmentata TaxID=450801 RepID=A0ABW5FNQ4_9PSEU